MCIRDRSQIDLSDEERIPTGRRLLDEAMSCHAEAEMALDGKLYPESVAASSLAMEKVGKGILAVCLGRYRLVHRFPRHEVTAAAKAIPEILPERKPYFGPFLAKVCARALIRSNMWSTDHTLSKYGLQGAALSPKHLFEEPEATRALWDAQLCTNALGMLLAQAKKLRFG